MKDLDIGHVEVVVTHKCNYKCNFCVDELVNKDDLVVKLEDIENLLSKISKRTDKRLEVLLLGGEPTTVEGDYLNKIADIVHSFGYKILISTNGVLRNVVDEIIDKFDWVQITSHNDKELEYWRNHRLVNKINIKLPGNESLNVDKLNYFIDRTKEFGRRSVNFYFNTNDLKDLCTDDGINKFLEGLEWKSIGAYEYTIKDGVRYKRRSKNRMTDSSQKRSIIPKLYPNGNYNKTWGNEDMDDFLK